MSRFFLQNDKDKKRQLDKMDHYPIEVGGDQ
jgi:hypothetical protein